MDWIHPWIGLDWIESGVSGNFVDWVGSHDCDRVFYTAYLFDINRLNVKIRNHTAAQLTLLFTESLHDL